MIAFNSLDEQSPRSLDYARDDKINTSNDIGHVISSLTGSLQNNLFVGHMEKSQTLLYAPDILNTLLLSC